MVRAAASLAVVALASTSGCTTNAFVPISHKPIVTRPLHMSSVSGNSDYFEGIASDPSLAAPTTNSIETDVVAEIVPSKPKKIVSKKKKKAPAHKDGIFSPVVYAGKMLLGEKQLNKVRGKIIGVHSDVIKNFVETSDSAFGQAVLKSLFTISDKNGDKKLDREEIAAAFRTLGFDWLKEKQIDGIIKRADTDEDGYICIDEFCVEAPKTLKTNLVKLAKKNGNDLGFLV